ncbi:MAG: 6-phospho-beta-glucosidase, partial [Firmicutes bacterium]|nr:6-phospho-beta-glucosidase [Bacillota bacterium]
LRIVSELARRMVEKSGADIRIHATLNRAEALKDADFVTTQFRVGLLEARIRDERIPLRYGVIGQETTGPGGFANALRTVPVILDICADMERCCPDAFLVNFTNPSGIVTEAALTRSGIKTIGLCNCPIGMVNDVAKACHCRAEDVYCDFIGLNHLLWARRVTAAGRDVTAQMVGAAAGEDAHGVMANVPEMQTSARFMRSLGMLPVDYLKYYYLTPEMLAECVEAEKTKGVRGEVVKRVEEELFALYADPALAVKPAQLSERGGAHYSDAACMLIDSIYNNKGDIQTVNVRNGGANLDLPEEAVIERNCVIDAAGAHPIALGHMPLKIRGLVQLVKAYEQLTVEAAVNGDRDAALQALTIHPLVPSSSVAQKLLDDILLENADFLPAFR